MNILAISGALRRSSTNTALLSALQLLAPHDMNIEIATLHGIPLYDGDAEEAGKPQSVLDLGRVSDLPTASSSPRLSTIFPFPEF
jgi:NAD(P)H-dependent FMN reductase